MRNDFTLFHSRTGLLAAKARLAEPVPLLRAKRGGAPQKKPVALKMPAKKSVTAGDRRQARHAPVRRVNVGIWSLDALLGDLGAVVKALNKTQGVFVFFIVEASVPSGLVSRPERMVAWLKEKTGSQPSANAVREIEDNIVADDYFGVAEGIRGDLGLDYMVGVTPSMVAGDGDTQVFYNHFSTFDGRAALVSSYDLQRFAKKTGRPFEAYLVKIIVSQLLVAMFYPRLHFHDDRGCLFDYDETRDTLADKVVDPQIEAACLDLIEERYRAAANSLKDLIRSYGERSR